MNQKFKKQSPEQTNQLGILLFSTPFASSANAEHGEKLINCLAPICRQLFVVADSRINLKHHPAHVVRQGNVPTLHYVSSIHPTLWSAIWWLIKLIWILLRGSWAVFETQKQVDVVLCYKGYYYTPILLCARLLGKKTITYLPNNEAEAAEVRYAAHAKAKKFLVYWLQFLQRVNQKLASICVVQSWRLLERLQLLPYQEKVRLGNLYVDQDFYRALTPFEARPLTVGFVGRLNPEKGIMPLLEAAALLHKSGITFQIVGDGPLREKIEAAHERAELSHLELVGWVNSDSLVEYLNRFRLLVLPTENEGVPNVVLEAMACGTPVLATGVDGIPDLIEHQVTGFILPNREPKTIAQAIIDALNCQRLAEVAKNGRKHVIKGYSLPAISKQWAGILTELGKTGHKQSKVKKS